jgi:NAD(P)-dependent dehydrogenase (short-subunit alcohol dehydrogenase family)
METGLEGKVAMVTGAAGGIGAAIGRVFCREHASTIFVDIDEKGLKEAVKGYEQYASYMVCNVSRHVNVQQLFSDVRKRFKTLHILVNNAAVNTADNIVDLKEADIDKIVDVNIKGYIHTTMEALPLMREAGFGRLIYINSSSGLKASAGLSLYSSSKYFNRGFALAAALEEGKYNITSNSIYPSDVYPEGEIEAKSWKNEALLRVSLEKENVESLEELIKKRSSRNPMRRSCKTEDVAWLALFLASAKAGFINGQSIGVNGGAIPY